eukprot:TRINITY_DN14231_c0_g1_i1.p2 TRINITY_DN14231_c0_g1~~TRINITY_DN14231_c0_g1_i1.p2  ORF type:complete len:145 (-),score=5.96 TRINITY_DN14231_c0_g1_i1:29-463(-)
MSASFCCSETGKDYKSRLSLKGITKEDLATLFHLYPETVEILDIDTMRWVCGNLYISGHSHQVYGLVIPSRYNLFAGRAVNYFTLGFAGVPDYGENFASKFYPLANERLGKVTANSFPKQTVDWTEWRFPQWRPFVTNGGHLPM